MTLSCKNIFVSISLCLLLASCSGIKHLPPGEKLYTGATIKLETTGKITNKKKRLYKNTVKNALRPDPNKKFLGLRPKLWMYNAAGENPENKIKKWLKKNGEAPVLLGHVKPTATAAIIDARLFNIGIFRSYTEFKTIEKKHTAMVKYISHIHPSYRVKELIYAVSNDSISHLILKEQKKSLIKPGDDYNLENLKKERKRIDELLKNNGYFYFDPDYLLFKTDSSNIYHDVTFRLSLKDSIPEKALTVYRINNVYIDQDYSLDAEEAGKLKDTLRFQGNFFLGIESEMNIRPKVISRSVYLRKNEIYSRINHNITLNRLMTMGNFKFVRLKFSDSDTSSAGFLDVTILMTPMSQYTFRAEIEMVSKSNNYTGPRLNTSLLNRNAFKGAELLNLSLAGSFEAQFSGKTSNLFSYAITPQVELFLPRLIVPFKISSTNSYYVPKTRFSLAFSFTKRVGYFDMRTFQFIFGYRWKKDIRKEHEFNPVNISYTTLANETPEFNELLETNPFLKKSYEEQFIAGGNYIYTYNEQVIPYKRMQYFYQIAAETAGNLFSLLSLITGQKVPGNPSTVVGTVYSQYARMSIDGRGFYNFKNKNKLALRFYAGVGVPYGNSSVLPYTKQFFSGGPNSIRAFNINSVGPGTYNQRNKSTGFMQLGGDIKLEMNAEYRFTIYSFLKGALFTDAGNVWLLKPNSVTPGGQFSLSGLYKEIAVGAGIGLRIDVSFFILRFDLAIPLRKPWLENGQRWVIDQIDFISPAWRSENLILNVAIGYPF